LRQGSGGYVLRALDPAGREVRVIVDGHSGRIVKVAPVPGETKTDNNQAEYQAIFNAG